MTFPRALSADHIPVSIEYNWYIVSTIGTAEDKIKKNVEIRAKNLDLQEKIVQVLVPTEEQVVFKEGKRRVRREKLFPGYILVYMQLETSTYLCVRETPGVTGFITGENPDFADSDQFTPITLSHEETARIISHVQDLSKKTETSFQRDDFVTILGGPMDSFTGTVISTNPTKGTAVVKVSLMGREVNTEVPTNQLSL